MDERSQQTKVEDKVELRLAGKRPRSLKTASNERDSVTMWKVKGSTIYDGVILSTYPLFF